MKFGNSTQLKSKTRVFTRMAVMLSMSILGAIAPAVVVAGSDPNLSPVRFRSSALLRTEVAQTPSRPLNVELIQTISEPQAIAGSWDLTSVSSDNRLVASALTTDPQTFADTVAVWNLETGEKLYSIRGHQASTTAIAFSPDNRILATADYDYDNRMLTIRLSDAATGRYLRTLRRSVAPLFRNGAYYFRAVLAFSPDSQVLYSSATYPIIQVWDVNRGVLQRSLVSHRDVIRALQVSPDGQRLATSHVDGTLALLNLQSGQVEQQFVGGTDAFEIDFSPIGDTVTATFTRVFSPEPYRSERQIFTWSLLDNSLLWRLSGFPEEDWLTLSPNLQVLAIANYQEGIRLLNVQTEEEFQTFDVQATNVTFSPDSSRFVAATEGRIHVWRITGPGYTSSNP